MGFISYCKPCNAAKKRAWYKTPRGRELNAKYAKAYGRKSRAAYRMMNEQAPGGLDAMRKIRAQHPTPIEGEEGLLAYWRGYLAGSRRTSEESERFARYQDIAFRVAAELDRKWRGLSSDIRVSYEDMVSIAYEAVLVELRRAKEPARELVALAIRRRIIDAHRSRCGKPDEGHGYKPRQVSGIEDSEERSILELVEAEVEGEEGHDLLERIRSRVGAAPYVDQRLVLILERRLAGHTMREIGMELGISEGRVCQLVTAAKPWLEEHVLPLVEIQA